MGSAGTPHVFEVTAVDQNGRLVGQYTDGRIEVAVVAIPDPRADVSDVSVSFMAVTLSSTDEPGGLHKVAGSFTPEVAGAYVIKTAFLKPHEVWDPATNVSDYTGLAFEQRLEVNDDLW